jgi:uncharacterized membrane protein YgcG
MAYRQNMAGNEPWYGVLPQGRQPTLLEDMPLFVLPRVPISFMPLHPPNATVLSVRKRIAKMLHDKASGGPGSFFPQSAFLAHSTAEAGAGNGVENGIVFKVRKCQQDWLDWDRCIESYSAAGEQDPHYWTLEDLLTLGGEISRRRRSIVAEVAAAEIQINAAAAVLLRQVDPRVRKAIATAASKAALKAILERGPRRAAGDQAPKKKGRRNGLCARWQLRGSMGMGVYDWQHYHKYKNTVCEKCNAEIEVQFEIHDDAATARLTEAFVAKPNLDCALCNLTFHVGCLPVPLRNEAALLFWETDNEYALLLSEAYKPSPEAWLICGACVPAFDRHLVSCCAGRLCERASGSPNASDESATESSESETFDSASTGKKGRGGRGGRGGSRGGRGANSSCGGRGGARGSRGVRGGRSQERGRSSGK